MSQREVEEAKPKAIKKLTFLQMIRRSSLDEASIRQFYKAPISRQPTLMKPVDATTKVVNHATQIDLRYS